MSFFFRSAYTSFYPKDQFINVPLDWQPQQSLLSLLTRCINVHLVKRWICIYAYRDVLSYTIAYICCSFAQSCPTLCNPMDCSMPAFPVLHHLPELRLMSIESVMPSNHLVLCRPLLLLPSILPSIRVFSNELAHFHLALRSQAQN